MRIGQVWACQCAKIGAACQEIGFFYVVDHGVPRELMEEAFAESRRFFALPLADGLRDPGLALPGTELLMTKLQIIHLNEKDREDCYALFDGCAIGNDGPTTIDPARIAHLTGHDWGLHHTFELNLGRLTSHLDDRALSPESTRTIAHGIAAVSEAMEAEPKSRGWRLRARIGERKTWYEEPEEVRR